MFEPWEIEEIACIHDLVQKYGQILDDIAEDVQEEHAPWSNDTAERPDLILALKGHDSGEFVLF